MKLPGTAADFVLAPVDANADAEQLPEKGWSQGSNEDSTWWWTSAQAADQYPAQWAVLDTNQVLSNLEAVQCIVAHMTGVNCVVPRVVLKELELLERLEEPGGSFQARTALRFLQGQLLAFDGFRCGSAGDRSSLVLQGESEAVYKGLLGPKVRSKGVPLPDDHVLACARYFSEVAAPGMTELLTSDCRMAIKAAFHGVPSESALELMGRGVVSPSGHPAVAVGCPPGLGLSADMTMLAEHCAESFLVPESDDNSEQNTEHGKTEYSPILGPQSLVSPLMDSSRAARHTSPSSEASKARERAASTRSPSSEDDCADPSEGSSSPECSTLDSPPGLVQHASPAESCILEFECDEEGGDNEDGKVEKEEEDEMEDNMMEENRSRTTWQPVVSERARRGRTVDTATVVLRGLPFNVAKEEVLAFVLNAGVSRQSLHPKGAVTLKSNSEGRPSGFAEIHLARGADFGEVRVQLHMQYLRGRYIEAFPPRPVRKSAIKYGGARWAGTWA